MSGGVLYSHNLAEILPDYVARNCPIERNIVESRITVELVEYWFQIVDGEKRWRACKKIGLTTISAIILESLIAESF